MFNYAIKQLPLTDARADEFFTRIKADSFNDDNSFCATLRALLYNRLQDAESITVKLDIKSKGDASTTIDQPAELAFERSALHGVIHIQVIKGLAADHKVEGFCKAEDISMYISGGRCKADVYMNESTRQVLVLMNSMTMRCWHKMQSAIPKLIPWHFTEPLQDIERSLLHSLTKVDGNSYIKIITEYASGFNYREDRLRRLLKDYCVAFEQQRYQMLREERDKNLAQFNHLQTQIAKCIKREQMLLVEISGLEMAIKRGGEMGMADYFVRNKNLNLISVDADSNTLTYVVTTYIEYFDQQLFDKCYNNTESFFYDNWEGTEDELKMYKALLWAVFGDESCIRVRTCAAFNMTFPNVLTELEEPTCLEDYSEWLEHPHIVGAHCMGSHSQHINDLMFNKKYIEAVEQTIASTKNINFADSGICRRFIKNLARGSQKFLELPTGEVVSPDEATDWLYREGKV